MGENRYSSESCCPTDALTPEQGWVLMVVCGGNSHTSEFVGWS